MAEKDRDELDKPSEPLASLARAAAIFVGAVSAAAGTWAVFSSANQAGTAALLVMAVVFLLVGIQGTPLTKLTAGASSLELATLRRQSAKQQLELAIIGQRAAEVIENSDPEVAEAVASVIQRPPRHYGYSATSRLAAKYADKVERTLQDSGFDISQETSIFDFELTSTNSRAAVETLFRSGGFLTAADASRVLVRAHTYPGKVIVVSNVPFTASGSSILLEIGASIYQFVWSDDQNPDELVRSIQTAITA